MKHQFKIALGAIALIAMANAPAFAQNVGSRSEANSGSQSSASVNVGSQSGAFLYQEASVIPQRTEVDINSVPSVSAPAIFGGGHPCLSGVSGGVSVMGFGGSYGAGIPEPACMAWYFGQPEVAIRIMAMESNAFCKAMGNVGYYRVGTAVVPFACGETVKGGVETPGVSVRRTKVSTRSAPVRPVARPALYSKCAFEGGKIRIQVKRGVDQASAVRACRAELGNP